MAQLTATVLDEGEREGVVAPPFHYNRAVINRDALPLFDDSFHRLVSLGFHARSVANLSQTVNQMI